MREIDARLGQPCTAWGYARITAGGQNHGCQVAVRFICRVEQSGIYGSQFGVVVKRLDDAANRGIRFPYPASHCGVV